jgi:threonine synthase
MTSTAAVTSALTHYECSICGDEHDADELQTVCRACGRVLFARYDLERAAATLSLQGLGGRVASMWRYAEVMPASGAEIVTLGEGYTPLLDAPRLAGQLGLDRLLVKDEGGNPTGTFKARGMSAAFSIARARGVQEIGVPTAGNAGSAASAYGARADVPVHVAMPADTPRAMMDEVRAYGAELMLVDGTIADAGALIRERGGEAGWFDVSTFKEPGRAEGKKTMGYELWEQLGGELPDVIIYPTGGGTGLVAMWKAFAELAAMGLVGASRPRMVAVQSEGCAPAVRAFEAGADRVEFWEDAATLAPGIRVPGPFADDLILATLRESHGVALAVPDDEIVNGVRAFGTIEGIDACPEGGATLAALRRLVHDGVIERDERVVLFNTGTGLKHPELRPSG